MQIVTNPNLIPPRKTYAEVVNPPNPIHPKRLKIVASTAIRGQFVWPRTVVEFDISTWDGREDVACLLGALKAVVVPSTTPLHVEPEPKPEVKPVVTETPEAQLASLLAKHFRK